MSQLEPILENLGRARTNFLRAADAIPPDKWKTRPREDKWSASELVAHVISVERAIVGKADRIAQRTPIPVPFFKRFHLPMALVEVRVIRRKSPIPLDESQVREKEDMLAELRSVRERTLAFIEETKERDLGVYMYAHAFLGTLNLYEWFQMVASHEIRHTKQMREIEAHLPKAVASLQK